MKLKTSRHLSKSEIKSLMNQLRSFWFIDRITRNFNYEDARRFIGEATCNNEYMIPNTVVGLKSELSRVLGALVSQKVMDLSWTLKSFLTNILNTPGEGHEIVGDFSYHPFALAVFNS